MKRLEYRWKGVVDLLPSDFNDVDFIFHLASQGDVPLANTSPRYTYQLNTDSMVSLTRALQEMKTPIVAMSTENVYGAVPPERLPAKEDEPHRPKNQYAASKSGMEAMLHAVAVQHGVPVGIVRSSTLFGERMRQGQVVWIFTQQALNDEPITIEGTGEQTRDFNYVSNMVDVLMKIMGSQWYSDGKLKPGKCDIWNIGEGKERSIKEFVDLVISITNSKSKIEHKPWRPGEEGRLCISIEKARKELEYEPKVSTEEGMTQLVGWMRHQQS
jgi:nucleoside-diphosphate-sugar epimerase